MNKQKQDLEEKCKQEFIETFEHCEKYGLDTKDIISSLGIGVCKQAKREERQRLIEEVIELVETTIGNDYHNIGMGSLDYHEKSAIDAFIESFKFRLTKLKGINEKHT